MEKKMKKILVTAFVPYWPYPHNSSEDCMNILKRRYPEIETVLLPVEYQSSRRILRSKIRECKPDMIFSMGQDAWARGARVETRCHKGFKDIKSIFAVAVKLFSDNYVKNNIGYDLCNTIYLEGLSHCKRAVFVHLPYRGRVDEIINIFENAKRFI